MRVLILGATSTLAHEAAKHFARDGADLVLVARSVEKLATIEGDLGVRGAKRIETIQADLADLSRHQEILDNALQVFDGLDMALIAYGTLGNQKHDEQSLEATL
ncbi:MAG TPA: SDR family NAD(P)-dependent oxidoreductase, partial [Ktedonobacteraceae bacterium]|nr:SDR family NAD(P)-dependent oxidoreductase [Ktedonobacteraceae bacterium]